MKLWRTFAAKLINFICIESHGLPNHGHSMRFDLTRQRRVINSHHQPISINSVGKGISLLNFRRSTAALAIRSGQRSPVRSSAAEPFRARLSLISEPRNDYGSVKSDRSEQEEETSYVSIMD